MQAPFSLSDNGLTEHLQRMLSGDGLSLQDYTGNQKNIIPEAFIHLANALKENSSVTSLKVVGNPSYPRLKVPFHSLGLTTISQALIHNRALRVLLLEQFSYDASNSSLTMALRINHTLTHLTLRRCEINAEDVFALCGGLQDNGTITHLDLSNNPLKTKGVQLLSRLFHPQSRIARVLEALILNNVESDDAGLESLTTNAENSALKVFEINDNRVSRVRSFTKLFDCKTLERLSLNGNPLAQDELSSLRLYLIQNELKGGHLRFLGLYCAHVSLKVLSDFRAIFNPRYKYCNKKLVRIVVPLKDDELLKLLRHNQNHSNRAQWLTMSLALRGLFLKTSRKDLIQNLPISQILKMTLNEWNQYDRNIDEIDLSEYLKEDEAFIDKGKYERLISNQFMIASP